MRIWSICGSWLGIFRSCPLDKCGLVIIVCPPIMRCGLTQILGSKFIFCMTGNRAAISCVRGSVLKRKEAALCEGGRIRAGLFSDEAYC